MKLARALAYLALTCALAAVLLPFAARAGLLRVANDVTGMAGLGLILSIWAGLLAGGTLLGGLAWGYAPKDKLARAACGINLFLFAGLVGLICYLRV